MDELAEIMEEFYRMIRDMENSGMLSFDKPEFEKPERMQTPYRPVCTAPFVRDKRPRVHRCRSVI